MRLRAEKMEFYSNGAGSTGADPVSVEAGKGTKAHRRYHNRSDQEFLVAVSGIVREHLADAAFETGEAAVLMSMSRMHLHRKLRALTGCSTRQYITARRLEKARLLLARPHVKVCDVAGQVGFRSASYFARAFARAFGTYPSEFAGKTAVKPRLPSEVGRTSVAPTEHRRQGRYHPSPATGVALPR
jgi:AraC-like DNA-binding protein